MTNQRLGGIASILLMPVFVTAQLIYLTGNLRDALGPFSYSVADFLAGPAWAASLVSAVFALHERIGERAPRRGNLALLATALAAAAMVLVACLRSANRQYHLLHPELHLENSTSVLVVWTTLITGVSAAGWHFLGWTLLLVGSAGWTTGRVPHGICILYLIGGIASLFVYVFPFLEGVAAIFGLGWGTWQGFLLWKCSFGEKKPAEETA